MCHVYGPTSTSVHVAVPNSTGQGSLKPPIQPEKDGLNAMVTFQGANARCGHPAGLGAIRRFWRKIKQFHELVTFENAAARWRLAHCKQKSPDVGDVLTVIGTPSGCNPTMAPVPSPNIAMAAVPPPGRRATAWRRHCSHGAYEIPYV